MSRRFDNNNNENNNNDNNNDNNNNNNNNNNNKCNSNILEHVAKLHDVENTCNYKDLKLRRTHLHIKGF